MNPTLVAMTTLADQSFALTAFVARRPGRIDIGGVDHHPAGVDERVEDGETRRFVGGPVEDIAAECERRDRYSAVANRPFLDHRDSPLSTQ